MNIILCLYPMYSSVSCRSNTLLRRAWSCVEFVLSKLFPRINNVFELQQNGNQKITQYGCLLKENFWRSIQICLTCRYLHINQLKNPFQMNIILCLYPKYSSVSCRPNALLRGAWSCVESVLSKLFPRINNVFELQQNRNRKNTQNGSLLKGNFPG